MHRTQQELDFSLHLIRCNLEPYTFVTSTITIINKTIHVVMLTATDTAPFLITLNIKLPKKDLA